MKIVHRLPAEDPNHGDTPPRRQFLVLGAYLIAFVAAVYFVGSSAVSLLAIYMPQDWEHKIFAKAYSPNAVSDSDPRVVQLQSLLDRIRAVTPEISLPLKATLISDQMPNAMAVPGGKIMVTDALLTQARSENELVMVLAHEVGHFKLRHHLRRIGRLLIVPTLSLVLLGEGEVAKIVQPSASFIELTYSRSEESEADSYALDVLNRIYGHVSGATDFFDTSAPFEWKVLGARYVSSHPPSSERIEMLQEIISAKGYRQGVVAKKPGVFGNP